MSTQNASKNLLLRWTTSKGLATILTFFFVALLIELLVVFYSMSLGVTDTTPLQWSFKFPGTEWISTITISPLFHLVPIAVILVLVTSWIYLTKCACMKPRETLRVVPSQKREKEPNGKKIFGKIKSELLKASMKSAIIVVLSFVAFVLVFSLLAYPQLIYRAISDAYEGNPSLLSFVKSTGGVFAPIASAISGAVRALAPGLRDFAVTLGNALKPLAGLDGAGKYLAFQNAAAWISAMLVLLYAEYSRKSYRYRKRS